ncbi:RNA-binding protein [Methanoplanus sp. FWC-SCC4]|uniref:RNA-binding protein n=1 Tax=Methanochimaera problematica TaxID=2609417 RepID=A0AA97I4B5_9EURY|nr:RNA-binding protein [Methanoplanus sp. FWC-SCC4]WOF16766.1 RNA-binding protein [Methanoplanus sp. FWC-SCC4]
MVNNKIYVGNLLYSLSKERLEEQFSLYGNVTGIKIVQRRYAYITYETEEEAKNAVRRSDGMIFYGRKIKVELAIKGK